MKYYNSVQEFYDEAAKVRSSDSSFARKTDKELTEKQIAEINEYWGKYSFAYPEIDYESFKTFKNRYGKLDVRHIPGNVKVQYLNDRLTNENYKAALQNKALLTTLFPNVKQPETVVSTMGGCVYGKDLHPVSKKAARALMAEELKNGNSLVIKTSGVPSGKGIEFIEANPEVSDEQLGELMKKYWSKTAVVQKCIRQSEFTEKLNPGSVNTLRVSSLLMNGKVHILAAYLRVGKSGSKTDLFAQGGSVIGVDADGKCNNWALNSNNRRVSVLENGFDLKRLMVVPGFERIKKLVKEMHFRIPYVKMVSWDFALDEKNEPIFIDNNFNCGIQLHEAVTGPIFGKLTDLVLDSCLLNKFSIPVKYENWIVDEFADHVVITAYVGEGGEELPETINGKPVSSISADAQKAV